MNRRDLVSYGQDLWRLARAGKSIAQLVALGYSVYQATKAVDSTMSKDNSHWLSQVGKYATSGPTFSKKRKSLYQAQRGTMRTSGYYNSDRNKGVFQELKFFDVAISEDPIATAGTIVPTMNGLVQGTGETERIGRKVLIKKLQFRYRIRLKSTTSIAEMAVIVRVIIYIDKQCNGAAATAGQILQSDWQSFRNLENSQRFTILEDKNITINASISGNGTTEQAARTQRSIQWFKDVNIPLEFNATLGAITEIRSNNIGILLIADGAFATLDGIMRLRFYG